VVVAPSIETLALAVKVCSLIEYLMLSTVRAWLADASDSNIVKKNAARYVFLRISFINFIAVTSIFTKQNVELSHATFTMSPSALRLSVCTGSATFCPYLTISLAFLFFWALDHKKIKYLLRKLVRNQRSQELLLTLFNE
jgi:hypothetical protein